MKRASPSDAVVAAEAPSAKRSKRSDEYLIDIDALDTVMDGSPLELERTETNVCAEPTVAFLLFVTPTIEYMFECAGVAIQAHDETSSFDCPSSDMESGPVSDDDEDGDFDPDAAENEDGDVGDRRSEDIEFSNSSDDENVDDDDATATAPGAASTARDAADGVGAGMDVEEDEEVDDLDEDDEEEEEDMDNMDAHMMVSRIMTVAVRTNSSDAFSKAFVKACKQYDATGDAKPIAALVLLLMGNRSEHLRRVFGADVVAEVSSEQTVPAFSITIGRPGKTNNTLDSFANIFWHREVCI